MREMIRKYGFVLYKKKLKIIYFKKNYALDIQEDIIFCKRFIKVK